MFRFIFPVPSNAGEGGSAGGAASTTGAAGGGAPAGGAAGAAGGGGAAGTPPSWYGAFSEENRGYIEAKGFKGAEDVVTSYRGAEKLLGVPKEKLLRIPDKDDSPEWNEIHGKLGRPDQPTGYGLEVPEGGDKAFAEWAGKTFHELGLSKKQGEKLVTEWNKRAGDGVKAQEAKDIDDSHKQFNSLKQEWGAGFEAKVRAKNEFAKAVGIDDATHAKLEATMGVDGFAKLMDGIITKFGIKLGEHQFHGGGGGNNFGSMTPEGATAKRDMLLHDGQYRQRYLEGGANEREEIGKLEKFIWEGKQNLQG